MIEYNSKELQYAAERLENNADFQLIAAALQEDYRQTSFSSAPQDTVTRETCYQRHSMLEEFRSVVTELRRQKLENDKHG